MTPDPRHFRTWLALFAALLVCAQVAEAAEATCRATRIGPGARVSLSLDELLDRDLFRLVRLGLKGRITIELRVVRKGLLFGRTVSRLEVETSLEWSNEADGLLLDGRPVLDPRRLEIERISVDANAPPDAELEVEASARLQVVTAQSLGDMARWITGGSPASPGGSVSKNLLGLVADDLTRTVHTSCPVQPRKVNDGR